MAEEVRAVIWEAPEHHHLEKSTDWFWALGIVAVAAAAASIVFGNTLFGIVILIGTFVMMLIGAREPHILPFSVTTRGVRVGQNLYPYSTLRSFYIDTECEHGPQLLLRSQHLFTPLIIMPIPDEHVDDIDDIVSVRLPEEHLEEPFANRLLEFFGF